MNSQNFFNIQINQDSISNQDLNTYNSNLPHESFSTDNKNSSNIVGENNILQFHQNKVPVVNSGDLNYSYDKNFNYNFQNNNLHDLGAFDNPHNLMNNFNPNSNNIPNFSINQINPYNNEYQQISTNYSAGISCPNIGNPPLYNQNSNFHILSNNINVEESSSNYNPNDVYLNIQQNHDAFNLNFSKINQQILTNQFTKLNTDFKNEDIPCTGKDDNMIKDLDEIADISFLRTNSINHSTNWKASINTKVESRFNEFRKKIKDKVFEKKFYMIIDDDNRIGNHTSFKNIEQKFNQTYDFLKFIEKEELGGQKDLITLYDEIDLTRKFLIESFFCEFDNFDIKNDISTCKICNESVYLIDKQLVLCWNSCFSFSLNPEISKYFSLDNMMELFFIFYSQHKNCKSEIYVIDFVGGSNIKQFNFECSKCYLYC